MVVDCRRRCCDYMASKWLRYTQSFARVGLELAKLTTADFSIITVVMKNGLGEFPRLGHPAVKLFGGCDFFAASEEDVLPRIQFAHSASIRTGVARPQHAVFAMFVEVPACTTASILNGMVKLVLHPVVVSGLRIFGG